MLELSQKIHVAPDRVATNVKFLSARGLVSITSGESLTCRYGAQTPELEKVLKRLLDLYNERPVTMIRMVYEKPNKSLRTFAETFRLRKEE